MPPIQTIRFYRGVEADIPTLAEGEPGFTTDTHKLFIGDGATNHEIGGGGSGDVTAASAFGTDNRVIRSDGAGKGVQASSMTIEDTGDVTVSGTITASNLSGTNTGDQTITMTGHVTGSGTGSFPTTIADNAVTDAILADMPAYSFKGNPTASTASPQDIFDGTLTSETPASGDQIIAFRSSAAGEMVTFDFDDLGGGGSAWTESNQNTNFTIGTTNYVLYTIGPVIGGYTGAVSLPAVSGNAGLMVAVKLVHAGSFPATIDGNGSETIDDALTCVLTEIGDCVALYCTGSEWLIVWDNRKTWMVESKSADFTAGASLTSYHCDVSGASRTASLPAAADSKGKVLTFKLTTAPGGNTLTIDGHSTETIDGATTLVLYVLDDFVTLLCDGSNWKVISDGRIPHRCLLTNNAAQTISNSTLTIVTFNTETFDGYGMHSTSSNTGRINILRTGQYWVYVFVIFASATTGVRQVYFKVNGSYTQSTIFPIAAGSETQVNMPVLVNLTAGDYVECVVWHNNGGNLNINNLGSALGLIIGIVEVR